MLFNNIDFEKYGVVEYIRRQLLPPITPKNKKVPGRIGVRPIRMEIGERTVEVDLRIIEKDRIETQRIAQVVAGKLLTLEPQKLILRDQPDMFNLAQITGDTDFEKFLHTGFSTLEFLCEDPASYSRVETRLSNISNKRQYNPGTLPANGFVTIRVSSTVQNMRIVLQETGDMIYLATPFKAGDVVTIDLEEEWVRKNDILIMDKVNIESDFFEIPVGSFTITASPGITDLTFRKRWI